MDHSLFEAILDYTYEEACDSLYAATLEDYFMEEGSGGGVIKTLLGTITKFFKRIRDTFEAVIKSVKEKLSKVKLSGMKGTVKIPAKYQKLIEQGKIRGGDLLGCKTEDDVKRVVSQYRKKKIEVMAGTAFITLSIAAAVNYIAKSHKETANTLKKDEEAYKKLVGENYDKQRKINSLQISLDEAKKTRDRNAAEVGRLRAQISGMMEITKARMMCEEAIYKTIIDSIQNGDLNKMKYYGGENFTRGVAMKAATEAVEKANSVKKITRTRSDSTPSYKEALKDHDKKNGGG